MGAALSAMVANLSANKRGWDDKWEKFSDWAIEGLDFQNQLLALVDEDTNAFNKIMDEFEKMNPSSANSFKKEQKKVDIEDDLYVDFEEMEDDEKEEK